MPNSHALARRCRIRRRRRCRAAAHERSGLPDVMFCLAAMIRSLFTDLLGPLVYSNN